MLREVQKFTSDPRFDEIRLLAEAGFLVDARIQAEALREERPTDLEAIGLQGHLAHRTGAISEALRLWKSLHESSPHAHAAVVRLATLRDEEGNQGGGSPRTDLPLVRRAIRHVADGRLDRALSLCEEGRRLAIAASDGEQRKLLALLEALIHEISGRYLAAAAVLERLGQDPAYAHDLDRLALLARVSESAKDRGGLISAERVLDFLASCGKLSAFERLIEVRRMLGDVAGVQQAQASYEEAFRKRMHWLNPDERLSALERLPLPISRLRGMTLPSLDRIHSKDARGIVLLARGKIGQAKRALGPNTGGWGAVVHLADGAAGEAVAGAVEAIQRLGRPDGPLAFILCEAWERAPHASVPDDVLTLARLALERITSESRPERETLLRLSFLEERTGRRLHADTLLARLAAVQATTWPPPGVVRAAAVYALPGKPKGLVHDVIARRRPAYLQDRGRLLENEIHGELAPGSKAQIRRTFAATREWLSVIRPELTEEIDNYSYGIHVTKEDEPSGGPSLGLPAAVAFVSSMLGLQVPSHLVFTGALSYDCVGQIAVLPVGEVGLKLKGVLHAGATTLVLPRSQRDEVLSGVFVPRGIAERSIALVETLGDALAVVLAHGCHAEGLQRLALPAWDGDESRRRRLHAASSHPDGRQD